MTATESEQKILRTSFCNAANQLTQLYMVSLKQEKISFKKGYCQALDAVLRHLQHQARTSNVISIDLLIEQLNNKKREVCTTEDVCIDQEDELDDEEEVKYPTGSSQQQPQFGMTNHLFSTPSTPVPSSNQTTQQSQQHQQQSPFVFAAPPTTTISQQSQPTSNSLTLPNFSAASTFTQAVSNTIPFPTTPTNTNRNNNSRKRQFFEFLFESTTNNINNQNLNNNSSTSNFSTLFNIHPTGNTSTSNGLENDGIMDCSSSYPTQTFWKRTKTDENLIGDGITISNQS